MVSSSNSTRPSAGQARLEVALVAGQSTVTAAYASSPLKLLTPRSRAESVWACTSSFGGGLLAGDQTRLDVRIGPGARCFLSTQASTKVYRNPAALPCGHETRAVLDKRAVLVFAPDRVQPFAQSSYTQFQEWRLSGKSGLVLLDWFCSGRVARGERWQFARFKSRNDVFVEDERVFVDSIRLDGGEDLLNSPHRVGRFECFAMMLVIGPPLRAHAATLLDGLAARPVGNRERIVCSASPVREGAVLRIAGQESDAVRHEIERHLQPLNSILGYNPWVRKW